MNEWPQDEQTSGENLIPFSDFLQRTPPSTLKKVEQLGTPQQRNNWYDIQNPDIELYCASDKCNGVRVFRCTDAYSKTVSSQEFCYFHVTYRCSNCRQVEKIFSLAAKMSGEGESGTCYKFGELPPFGPAIPSRLIKLIEPDRELFLKGLRSETLGLGVGAFVYYRRVVENQKNRVLDKIIRVANMLEVPSGHIDLLEKAKSEKQFSRAMTIAKPTIPQTLLIKGHNPLTLLHDALSDGLHSRTDEHCLELATSIRVILVDLSERLAQALRDDEEVNAALATLHRVKVAE